jgi:uncharacterized membrane protein YeaQ/YmgE (transglycosylase-associated protein family)
MAPRKVTRTAFVLTERGDSLRLKFLSSRTDAIFVLVLGTTIGLLPVTLATRSGATGLLLSVLWGCMGSAILGFWFLIVPKVARQDVIIESDVVRIQRSWFRIPLGQPQIYARNTLTDLGAYFQASHGRIASRCALSIWHNGRTIELERTFPTNSVRQLQWELAQREVVFPVTVSQPILRKEDIV